jgi:hypothetical protein
MLNIKKTLIWTIFSILMFNFWILQISADWNSWFSELPNSLNIFNKELLKENKALKSCNKTKSCNFTNEYIKVLKSEINTLKYNSKKFKYIENAYWKSAYNYLIENETLIDLKFDEYLTQELINFNSWRLLSKDNWYTNAEIKTIYSDYIRKIWFNRLYNLRKNSKTLRDKVLYSYELFLMFGDIRLYSIN